MFIKFETCEAIIKYSYHLKILSQFGLTYFNFDTIKK